MKKDLQQNYKDGDSTINYTTFSSSPLGLIQLLEANVKGALAQALTAHVQVVLPDDGALVGAHAAAAGALGAKGLLGVRVEQSLAAHVCVWWWNSTGGEKGGGRKCENGCEWAGGRAG